MYKQRKSQCFKTKLYIFIYLCLVLVPNFISITSVLNFTTKKFIDSHEAATERVNQENLNLITPSAHVSRKTKVIASLDKRVEAVKKGLGLDFIIAGYPKCGTSTLRYVDEKSFMCCILRSNI